MPQVELINPTYKELDSDSSIIRSRLHPELNHSKLYFAPGETDKNYPEKQDKNYLDKQDTN